MFKKIMKALRMIWATIMGLIQGKGVSSIDRAKRREQIRERDKLAGDIDDAVSGGDIEDLNDQLGWEEPEA